MSSDGNLLMKDYLINLIKEDNHYMVETFLKSVENYHTYKDQPLYFYANSTRMVSILWRNNINLDIINEYGQTAFYHKPVSFFSALVRFLPLEHKDHFGNTILMHTVMYENAASYCKVKELLANGANPNCRNPMGQTPLFYCQSIKILRELLKAGADPYATDSHGNNAILYNMNPNVIHHLISNFRYNINHQNHDGNTALMTQQNKAITTILLDKGIDHTIKNNDGFNAVSLHIMNDPLLSALSEDYREQSDEKSNQF